MRSIATPLLTAVASCQLALSALGMGEVKLVPGDGAASDRFGRGVAIDGTTVVIGSPFDDDSGADSGSVYLFDAGTGQQVAKLLPKDGAPGDLFGWSVALSGTTAIAGAVNNDDKGSQSGSAYLFDTTTGQQLVKLLAADGASSDWFGDAVAISGTTAIVGARFDDDNGSNSGSAYLFETVTGQELAKLRASDGASADYFSRWGIAINDTTAIVGSAFDDDNGSNSGSAYLYDSIAGQEGPQWTDLGNSLDGSAGPPLLRGWGDLSQGSAVTLDLTNAAPNAPTVLVAGLSSWYLSYKGGVMVPFPDFFLYPGLTDPSGRLYLQYPNLPGLPGSTTIHLQYWLPDPGGPRGWAASNAASQTAQ